MLGTIVRTLRLKAAIFLAVFYAFAVLAPYAAIAFVGPQGLLHCLTEGQAVTPEQPGLVGAHVHTESTPHSHDKGKTGLNSDEQKRLASACCGLFTAPAVVFDLQVVPPVRIAILQTPYFAETSVDGQGPGRIIRPPIA
jgi:hypothetical protein